MLCKINSILLSLAVLSIILLFASCGNDYEDAGTDLPYYAEKADDFVDETDDSDEEMSYFEDETDYWFVPDYTTFQASDKIQITIAHITGELLAEFDNFVEISQYGRNPRDGGIAFIPNVPVNNFRYIRISAAEIFAIVEEELFLLDTLLPETPLLRNTFGDADFHMLTVIPRYEAIFDGSWHFVRHYTHISRRPVAGLHPNWMWRDDERGLDGVSYIGADGIERFFIIRYNGEEAWLEEFDNSPMWPDSPLITIARLTPEIELIAAWFGGWHHSDAETALASRDGFLQQFDSYTYFDAFSSISTHRVIFSANTDLHNFEFFRLAWVDCYEFIDGRWEPWYVGEVLAAQDIVPFGEPVVVPWHPGGTFAVFGFGFLDEYGIRRNFWLNPNEASGFPPLAIGEFLDRGSCGDCGLCIRRKGDDESK